MAWNGLCRLKENMSLGFGKMVARGDVAHIDEGGKESDMKNLPDV